MVAKCEHEAVEQTRGAMGDGDYFDAVTNSLDEARHARLPADYHNHVELDETNRTDFRIVCKKCFLSTGWMRVDVPGMPAGIGIPAVKARWDDVKQHDVEEWNALQRKKAVKSKTVKF